MKKLIILTLFFLETKKLINVLKNDIIFHKTCQKQSPGGVLMKRCFKYMQQIYRRTSMLKCHFNNFPKQVYKKSYGTAAFCNSAAYFQNSLSQEHFWETASEHALIVVSFKKCYFFENILRPILRPFS